MPRVGVAETLREELRQMEVLQGRLAHGLAPGRQARLELEADLRPTCAEAQADGTPCPGPHDACDCCVRALVHVRALRAALELAVARAERRRAPDPRDP